jgi:hypothetical protein
MSLVFLPMYPEPRKVPTNPRWCPYAKGSPREGQAPRSSNSIESCGPSPCASGALLPAPLGRSPPSPLSSFRPKMPRASFPPVHGGGRDTNAVVTVSQDSRPTRYNYNDSRKSRVHYMPWYVAWAPTPSNGQLGEVYIGPNSKIVVGEKL